MQAAHRERLKILRIELEDLREQIDRRVRERRQSQLWREIGEWVCLENVAVLRSEDSGPNALFRIRDAINLESHETLESPVIEKVRRYVAGDEAVTPPSVCAGRS